MLDTAVEGSGYNRYTVYPPQIWIHMDTMVRYITVTTSQGGGCTSNAAGQIHDAQKSRMAHGTADKLVFCHEVMHVQLRMQDAGWSAEVERWESDEDSDGSADELDRDVVEGLHPAQ